MYFACLAENRRLSQASDMLSSFEQKVEEHKRLSAHVRTCRSTIKVYWQYKAAKNPKLFRKRHLSEISRYESSWQQLKCSGYKKVPFAKYMKETGDRLSSSLEKCRLNYERTRDRCNEASGIRDTITEVQNRPWERKDFDFDFGRIRQTQEVHELTR